MVCVEVWGRWCVWRCGVGGVCVACGWVGGAVGDVWVYVVVNKEVVSFYIFSMGNHTIIPAVFRMVIKIVHYRGENKNLREVIERVENIYSRIQWL